MRSHVRRPIAPTLLATVTLALTGLLLASVAPSAARADFIGDLAHTFERSLANGTWGLSLGLIFLAGLATSLTPCVFPMIAITVSVFGARQAKTKLEGAKLSTSFVLGIATLFTPLGVVAGLSGDLFGAALASAWVLIPLAAIFLALAASMFGAFELNLPPALQNKLSGVGGVGTLGAFLFGLVSSIIAAPCTGPVVGALLSWIGTTRSVAFGGLAMFVYALGLGTLTWIVGTFAISLPKSGAWVEWTKSVFGIVMIVAALYYLRDLLGIDELAQKTTVWLLASLGLGIVGVLVGAVHLSFHDGWPVRIRKGIGVALATAGLAGFVGWLSALPPLPPGARIAWMDDYAAARALARREHKPLLVDFGASWCGACGELDRGTFTDPRVVSAARDFVAIRVDLSPDTDTPAKRAVLRSYNERGLPLVVVHGADGVEVARIKQFVPPEEFVELLERGR
jgi:thiol:disulfide interchange protein DsbD